MILQYDEGRYLYNLFLTLEQYFSDVRNVDQNVSFNVLIYIRRVDALQTNNGRDY